MNWFLRPYPYEQRFWRKAFGAIGFGIFIALFLFIFQPFGLHEIRSDYHLRIFGGFGLITVLASWLADGIMPLLFPRYYRESRWTVLSQILHVAFVLILIGSGNYIFSLYWGFIDPGVGNFFSFQVITLIVGIFPIAFSVMLNEVYLLKRNLREAREIGTLIHAYEHNPTESDTQVTLQGDNQEDYLSLSPQHILYLRAADNYVEVWYDSEAGIQSKLLRTTLSAMEAQLDELSALVRCHRSYIVNLDRVQDISGNAQGYRLQIGEVLEPVPVSRSQRHLVRERLT